MKHLKSKAQEISEIITNEVGDIGACVWGCYLLVDGEQFIPQPVQGDSTCMKVYASVKEMLIENGVDESRITIDEGEID